VFALPKPERGSALRRLLAQRAETRRLERAAKLAVIARDGSRTCRLVPGCRERRRFETAHLEAKGVALRLGDGLLWASATETDEDEYRIDVTAMTGAGPG